ncbi:membrane protein FAM174B [Pyrgilauda ruficollis]|nr:membrane protein FAM174B [Pyrgilauda ruficollis]
MRRTVLSSTEPLLPPSHGSSEGVTARDKSSEQEDNHQSQELFVLSEGAAPAPAAAGPEAAARPREAPGAEAANGSRPPAAPGPGNHSGARLSPVPAMLRDLSALKAAVIGACALTAALIACLLLRVFRSGKRIKKTRKYDIITTPAERVEMAPLNEEDDEDEDSTVFDVKYR